MTFLCDEVVSVTKTIERMASRGASPGVLTPTTAQALSSARKAAAAAKARRSAHRRQRSKVAAYSRRVAYCLYGGGRNADGGICAVAQMPLAWTIAVWLVVGIAASVFAYFEIDGSRREAELSGAHAEAVMMAARLSDALANYERGITMMAAAAEGLVLARGGLHAGIPFDPYAVVATAFLESLEQTSTGGAFLVRVPHAARSEFEANATREHAVALNRTRVVIHAGDVDVPAANATDYFPVAAAATTPLTAGPRVSFFFRDLVAIPDGGLRRQAVESAMLTGNITATPPLDLVGNFGGLGYILYARVGSVSSGFDGTTAMGVVLTAVPSQQLVATLLGVPDGIADALSPGHDVTLVSASRVLLLLIEDVTDVSRPSNLVEYWSDGEVVARDKSEAGIPLLASTIVFAGRFWRVRINMRQSDYIASVDDGTARLALGTGIFVSLSVAFSVALYATASSRRARLRVMQLRADVAASTHNKLVSYICHELRNPLHHLRAGFRFFERDHGLRLTKRMTQDLALLSTSVAQMHHVVNDILDIRKLSSGNVDVEQQECDVRAFVRDLTNQLRDAVGSDVILRVVVSKTLPVKITTDPMRLRQLIGNALHNAAKFTESGHIDLIVRTFRDNKWLLAEVRNTGIGLSGKDADLLLGKYGELDEGGTSDSGGRSPVGWWSSSSLSGKAWRLPTSGGTRAVSPFQGGSGRGTDRHWTASSLTRLNDIDEQVYSWFAASVSATEGREIDLPEEIAAEYDQFVLSRSGPGVATESIFSSIHNADTASDSVSMTDDGISMLLKATGLGLGLPLCTRIAHRMGGDVGLADVKGFTRWWVVLPLMSPVEPPQQLHFQDGGAAMPVPSALDGDRETKGLASEDSGVHVVAVDDEKLLRTIMSRWLNDLRVRSTILSDGDELASTLAELQASGTVATCVLLDIVMMRSDGSHICRALRASGITLPIYAMTGNVDSENVKKFRAWGFSGILGKPFTCDDVAAAIEHARSGARRWLSRVTPTSSV